MSSLFSLQDRVAIVTGGSRGLGEAIARGFSDEGARVVIASRKADACDRVATDINASGGQALSVPTHVGRPDEIQRLVDATIEGFGRVDIIVNNAANPLGAPMETIELAAMAKSYETNVLGPLALCQAALPHLRESSCASVVNVITVGAFAAAPYLGAYASSKAALWNLTRTMAKEWAPYGIRVNAIAPGPFDTDMMALTLSMDDFRREIVEATALKRVAQPSEIVGAALLLASDAGSYMTGSAIVVDGGTVA